MKLPAHGVSAGQRHIHHRRSLNVFSQVKVDVGNGYALIQENSLVVGLDLQYVFVWELSVYVG